MKQVLVVMGTRPEAIKLAPVVRALGRTAGFLSPVVCATAQHRELLDQVLELFAITPEHDLDIMREGQTLTFVTIEVLERIGSLMDRVRPSAVVVQGDTTTAMSAGLAAFYRAIPVAHVEAGLRTDDRYSPFPEETNRRLITRLAEIHFAATADAARRLRDEREDPAGIYLTGNPVVDAVLWMRDRARVPMLDLDLSRRIVLVTAHRRENFGAPLRQICGALRRIVEQHPDVEVVYPMHPNPEVTATVRELLGGIERVHLIAPLAYDEFLALMSRAYLILTDSGGVQEEAPVLGKPVLVLRENTERHEAVVAGATRLIGTDEGRIVAETGRLLSDAQAYRGMAQQRSPFGDGRAGERISDVLMQAIAGQGDGADRYRFRPSEDDAPE